MRAGWDVRVLAALLYLLIGLAQVVRLAPYAGDGARDRVDLLDERRAQGLREAVTSGLFGFLAAGAAAMATVGVMTSLVLGDLLRAVLWVAAAAAVGTSELLRRRARPRVLAAVEGRGLAAPPRERGATRERRQRVLAGVILAGLVVGQLAGFFAARGHSQAWAGVEAGALVVLVVAAVAFAWASVWVHGDERRD